jgi:hypothetical protein
MNLCFIDESGSPSLKRIDPSATNFSITACIFSAEDYLNYEIPELNRLKYKYWHHEGVILHSHAIRQKNGPFSICNDPSIQTSLYTDLAKHFVNSSCTIISAVIDMKKYSTSYHEPYEAYSLAAGFVLERLFLMVGQDAKIIFESRDRQQNRELEKWYQSFSKANATGKTFGYPLLFAEKKDNICGLQLADLACTPIIAYVKDRNTRRPDWAAVKTKIRTHRDGQTMDGYGLKLFP